MSLTERKIKYLEPGKSRQIIWDNGGFGMQVSPEGEKSFIMEYRFNEMTKMVTLGIYPNMNLETARRQAIKAYEMIIQGLDPEEKGIPAPAAVAAPGTPEASKQGMDQLKEKASSTIEDITGKAINRIKTSETLDKFKGLASQKLDKIKQRVEKKVKQAQGSRPLADGKIIPLEPKAAAPQPQAAPTPPPPPPPPPVEAAVPSPKSQDRRPEKMAQAAPPPKPPSIRDGFGRILDKNELKTLWSGLQNSDMSQQNQLAVKLLMVTAQNPSDVVASKGADHDLISKSWEIPGNLTPTGKKHKVPLTNLALDILKKIKEISGMTGVLFPMPGSVTPIDTGKLDDDVRRAQVRFGLKPFTLEDLRNSMVVQMLDNGIEEAVVCELLNRKAPAGTPASQSKVTDRDLRNALEKLERQLPKAY